MNEQRRLKRWAPKTRTGCRTCRIRRIKCDETRPVCRKCIASNRECIQYGTPFPIRATAQDQVVLTTLSQPDCSVTPFSHSPPPAEKEMFSTLRHVVVPGISQLFNRDFWLVITMQASQVYPAVWHAALAMAGAEQQCNPNFSRQSNHDFSLEQCSKAMSYIVGIQMGSSTPTPRNQEMLLITCLLLIRYCSLQGRAEEAFLHMKNGIRLLKQWRYGLLDINLHSPSCLPNCVAPAGPIVQYFLRLENQVHSSPLRYSSPPDTLICDLSPSSIIDAFSSANAAFTKIVLILNMHKRVVGSSMTVFGPPHLLSPQAQQFHAWKKEFSVFQQKLYFQEGQNFTNLAVKAYEVELTVLRIWELLGDILFTIDALQGQFHWEEFTGHFAKIVDLSGYVLRQDRSLIALLGEILQMAGNRCRDRLVQSRAILLLGTHPYRDGIFDSVFAARCATAKAKLEQQGIAMEQRGSSCECKFDSMSICDDHRIVSVTKQSFSQTHNQVTLRMKTAYEVRQGLSGTLINIAHSSS